MNKQKIFTFLYVFLIVALILFMIFMVFWLKSEGGQCAGDPIKYFENKNEDAYCTCIDYSSLVEINTENYINKKGLE